MATNSGHRLACERNAVHDPTGAAGAVLTGITGVWLVRHSDARGPDRVDR